LIIFCKILNYQILKSNDLTKFSHESHKMYENNKKNKTIVYISMCNKIVWMYLCV